MIYDLARTTRQHLAIQGENPAGTCIPKRCACGKACAAKQLVQHGKCTACVQAAAIAAIPPDDFAKLQHMLGASAEYPKGRWGWRNYYCAAVGAPIDAMRRLVAAGLATEGHSQPDGTTFFRATIPGCKAAGLDRAGIKRAMKDETQ